MVIAETQHPVCQHTVCGSSSLQPQVPAIEMRRSKTGKDAAWHPSCQQCGLQCWKAGYAPCLSRRGPSSPVHQCRISARSPLSGVRHGGAAGRSSPAPRVTTRTLPGEAIDSLIQSAPSGGWSATAKSCGADVSAAPREPRQMHQHASGGSASALALVRSLFNAGGISATAFALPLISSQLSWLLRFPGRGFQRTKVKRPVLTRPCGPSSDIQAAARGFCSDPGSSTFPRRASSGMELRKSGIVERMVLDMHCIGLSPDATTAPCAPPNSTARRHLQCRPARCALVLLHQKSAHRACHAVQRAAGA